MDADEMDRLDLQHRKYSLVIGDRHFLAPIGDNPQRILDLGTGTGTTTVRPRRRACELTLYVPRHMGSRCGRYVSFGPSDWD